MEKRANLSDYQLIERAIDYIRERRLAQPELAEIAAVLGISESHCQKLFRHYTGISPKRFLQYLTLDHAKQLLQQSLSVMDAALAAGLSGPSRLHDHFVFLEAVTPGEYASGGEGLILRYGFHDTHLGQVFLAESARGICRLAFVDGDQQALLQQFQSQWGGADLVEDNCATANTLQQLFEPDGNRLSLLVKGSNFQIKVWEALLTIPKGVVISYSQLASNLDMPSATRAVANAVGANPIACLIPCHRVLRNNGALGGYRWGLSRKQLLLARESAGTRKWVKSEKQG